MIAVESPRRWLVGVTVQCLRTLNGSDTRPLGSTDEPISLPSSWGRDVPGQGDAPAHEFPRTFLARDAL